MFNLAEIVGWIIHYKYAVIFPVAIVEGPIVTVIAGFLIAHGYLNFFAVYIIIVAGDLTGDVLYYFIGRWGRNNNFIMKIVRFMGITKKRLTKLEKHFDKHSGKTLIVGKITHGVGSVALFASGAAKMPLSRFIWFNFLGTLPKSLLLLLIGYFFGAAYERIGSYLDYTAKIMIIAAILLVVLYFIVVKIAKSIENKSKK